MSLEHVNPAIVAAILLIPFICCVLPLILWSFKYWREKRKELPEYTEEYHNEPKGFIKYFDGTDFIQGLEVDKEEGE